MTTTAEPYKGDLPHNWTGGEAITKWWRGSLVHLYRLRKPCMQCSGEMTIDVTRKALEGEAKNAGLLLQRCPDCRAAAKGGSSRPKIRLYDGEQKPQNSATVQVAVMDNTENEALKARIKELEAQDETLQMVNNTMREELNGLYAQLKELRERLARYELPAAMKAASENKLPWG
jgi:predicted nuclease with TOPRIM domain